MSNCYDGATRGIADGSIRTEATYHKIDPAEVVVHKNGTDRRSDFNYWKTIKWENKLKGENHVEEISTFNKNQVTSSAYEYSSNGETFESVYDEGQADDNSIIVERNENYDDASNAKKYPSVKEVSSSTSSVHFFSSSTLVTIVGRFDINLVTIAVLSRLISN